MNALAREFRFFSLLRFAVPTIVMMLVLSFYTVVDGIFVSRFVGSNALSAVNIAMPLVNIVSGIGVMFATGGSAIVAKEMGENQEDRARGHFYFDCHFVHRGWNSLCLGGLFVYRANRARTGCYGTFI